MAQIVHRKISDTGFPVGIDKGGFDTGYTLALLVNKERLHLSGV